LHCSSHFIIVRFAQWGVLVFSASDCWLTGNLIRDEAWLRRLTLLLLALIYILAILCSISVTPGVSNHTAPYVIDRSHIWMLLAALSGGQMLFIKELSPGRKFLLIANQLSEFASQVLRLPHDPALRWKLAPNARRLVEQRDDWTQVSQGFVEVVEEVICKRA